MLPAMVTLFMCVVVYAAPGGEDAHAAGHTGHPGYGEWQQEGHSSTTGHGLLCVRLNRPH